MARNSKKTTNPEADKDKDFVRKAMEKYNRAFDKEHKNILEAYEDLAFLAGDQWPDSIKRQREADSRPCLTINMLQSIIHTITGDIRLQRPSIKIVGVDDRSDPKTAEVIGGLFRHIENHSDARRAYGQAADSQVACGIGHLRVLTEYVADDSFDQELRIASVDDQVSVIWDPDSNFPNREDSRYCFLPIDLSKSAFEERYPDSPIEDFALLPDGRSSSSVNEWFGDDFVRVAEYWERRPEKRTLALLPDGSIEDVTDDKDRLTELKGKGVRIEERESMCVYRSVISSCHLLEAPKKWPGKLIPIIPVFGDEVNIGRRTVRHGVVRHLKSVQQSYNYMRSAEVEAVALQPKAPFMVTEKNVENFEDMWRQANTQNYPYLLFTPDPKNGNVPPQRINSGMNTAGMVEGLQLATAEFKQVSGVYEAALGQRSNEVSGRAIQARAKESDVGSYVYTENMARAIKMVGRILLDLIPHIYDAARTIRIIGEDGKADIVAINQQVAGIDHILNDVTIAAYDVALDSGPSYETKREESRDGMMTFLSQAPNAAPVVLDLIAHAQDWPNSDKFAERLKTLLPPQIQALEAQESGEAPPPPPPPDPAVLIEQAKLQSEQQKLQLDQIKAHADVEKAKMSLEEKRADVEIKLMELRAAGVESEMSHANAQAIQQGLVEVHRVLATMHEHMNAPKRVLRGADGRAVGVEANGRVLNINRGPDGKIDSIH